MLGLGVVFPLLPPLLSLIAKFVQLDPLHPSTVILVGDLLIEGEWLPDLLRKPLPPPPFRCLLALVVVLFLAPEDGGTRTFELFDTFLLSLVFLWVTGDFKVTVSGSGKIWVVFT